MRPAQVCEDPAFSAGISMGVSKSGSNAGDEFEPGIRKLQNAAHASHTHSPTE